MLNSAQYATSRSANLRARIPDFDKLMLLNETEVSQITGTPTGTLRRWRCAGRGPDFVKLEGSVRYHLSDVLLYVEKGRQSSVRASMEDRHAAQKTR
jgi:hypothetical protein